MTRTRTLAVDDGFDIRKLEQTSGSFELGNLEQASSATRRVALLDADGTVLSAAFVREAEDSFFAKSSGLTRERLDRSIALEAVWTSKAAEPRNVLPPVLYAALRYGRVLGRSSAVSYASPADTVTAAVLKLAPLGVAPSHEGLAALAQKLDVALYTSAQACDADGWALLAPTLADEAVETVQTWVKKFFAGSWTRAIYEKTMTREQYVETLHNMHHYVRQTTRHLGRCVAHSEDRELRNHFIAHLNGELNHEVMIENDLRQFGIDPEYVISHRAPNVQTRLFMAVQESAIGFYQDPVLLMACPLVAEGITAHLDQAFIDALRFLVTSWGIEKPEKATRFLFSHTHTDGGEDGHWQATVQMLRRYLTTEDVQRQFLCTVHSAAYAIERSFTSNVDELRLFG